MNIETLNMKFNKIRHLYLKIIKEIDFYSIIIFIAPIIF